MNAFLARAATLEARRTIAEFEPPTPDPRDGPGVGAYGRLRVIEENDPEPIDQSERGQADGDEGERGQADGDEGERGQADGDQGDGSEERIEA